MKFDVVIQTALPVESGTAKGSGKTWRKQTYVGTYDGSNAQYPKQIVFDVLGDKIEKLGLQAGGRYEVEVDFSAREWQGRWYMSAQCWKATAFAGQGQMQPQQPPTAQQYYGNPQYAQPVQAQQVGYPPQGAGPMYGQQTAYPVNPNSATPTLDSMGVTGYQPQAQQTNPLPQGDDDDGLPF